MSKWKVVNGDPAAWVNVDRYRDHVYYGIRELPEGKHYLYAAAPTEGAPVLVGAEELAGLRRDAERLDFLESLMKRTGVFGHKQTAWPLNTDMHIGSRGVSIYARTGIGSNTEFSVGGVTVREAIDAALAANGEKVG